MRSAPTVLAVLLLLGTAFGAPARAVEVRAVRLWAEPESTRIVLDLSGSAQHSLLVLSNPDRIVLDLAGARLASGSRAPPPAGVVKQVRMAHRPSGELRIVLDLSRSMHAKSFVAPPNKQYGYRLVIDLRRRGERRHPGQGAARPPGCARPDHRHRRRPWRRGSGRHRQERHAREGRGARHRARTGAARRCGAGNEGRT